MLDELDYDTFIWGQLTACNWPDLTLDEAESMVFNGMIFGIGDPNISPEVRISIACKDGNAIVYYDSSNYSWVFER